MPSLRPGPRLAFLLPVLVGAVLRLTGLTRQPLWVDELITINSASLGEPLRASDVLVNPQGPLPQVLLWMWAAVVGNSDLSLRLWAAVFGIAGLALAAIVFRRTLPRAALLATWLFALSPFHIWYSQEVRNYPVLFVAGLLVLWSLVSAIERPRARAWALHAAAIMAMLLCNLSSGLLLPAVGLALFVDGRRQLLPWLGSALLALLLVSPWLWVEFGAHFHWSGVTAGEAAVPLRGGYAFHPGALPFTFAAFVGGFGLGPSLRALHADLGFASLVPHAHWLGLAAAGTIAALVSAARGLGTPRIRLLFAWAFLPALFLALVAVWGVKTYNPRYLAVSQPVFLLLVADGIRQLRLRRPAWGWLVLLLLVVPMLVGWVRQSFDPEYGKEDFRGAAIFLEQVAGPGDLVLEQGVSGPLARYYDGGASLETFHADQLHGKDGGRAHLQEMTRGHERVWWVGSRLWYDDPDGRVRGWIAERGRPLAQWNGVGVEVRGYSLRGPDR